MTRKRECAICGGTLFTRTATARKPYHYKLSGLNRVFLIGIEVESCRECGAESPSIPKLGELHRMLAHYLVNKKDRLSGEELRFLRKLPGLPAKKFAELLCITPEHLSGAENGRRELSQSVDKLARAVVVEAIRSDETRSILLQYPTEIGEQLAQLRFSFDDNWTRAA